MVKGALTAVMILTAFLALVESPLHGQTIAIVHATLIDGTGAPPVRDTTIVIDGKTITSVGAGPIPPGAKIIDATARYVIPGLIDTNAHMVLNLTPEFFARHEDELEDVIAEAAQLNLKSGITTAFDSWGPLIPLKRVRDRIRNGTVIGTRLYIAGNIIGLSGPLGRDFQNPATAGGIPTNFAMRIDSMWEENVGPELLDDTPEQVRAKVKKYIARGPDFLKFAESSHNQLSNTAGWLMFSPEAARIIVEEGHKAGLIVQTHTQTVESLRIGVEAGIDMAQHPAIVGLHEIPDELVKSLIDHQVYCGVLAYKKERLDAISEIWTQAGGKGAGFSPDLLRYWQPVNIPKLIRAGALITMATDGGLRDTEFSPPAPIQLRDNSPTELGQGQFRWLEAIVEKGMTPMQAIVSATRNGAAAYHHLADFGTIEVGKSADLLILTANPLANISNVRKIAVVMKEGQVVDRDHLPDKKVLTK